MNDELQQALDPSGGALSIDQVTKSPGCMKRSNPVQVLPPTKNMLPSMSTLQRSSHV